MRKDPLLAFAIWAAVVTMTAPALFPGMTVLGSAPGHLAMLVPGAVTSSNVAQVTYLWIAVGVIFLLASLGFSFYAGHVGRYEVVYGALGGAIVLLLWLWISALVVLLGAEINAVLDRARAPEA